MANKSAKRLSNAQRKSWQTTLQNSAAKKNLGERRLISVVLDANVWISGLLFGGNSEEVVRFCLTRVEIVASEKLEEEILGYLKNQTDAPQKWRKFFRMIFEKVCTIVVIQDIPEGSVRDPKDNHIIAAALAGKCRTIITGDNDLLDLGSYQGITILSPADFLRLVNQE